MDTSFSVLLVDDEEHILQSSAVVLRYAGIRHVRTEADSRQVITHIEQGDIGVVVLDLFMPNVSGTDLLTELCRDYPHIPVIVMTAADEVATAVECMRLGAFDYLVKPVDNARLISSVKRAIEMCSLKNQVRELRDHLLTNTVTQPEAFASIITTSVKMTSVFQYCEVIAPSMQPVIVLGETGVGKELIAQAIHRLSGVPGKFVTVNIAGLDDNMLSDTLFGHTKGAFTGADQARKGLITQAAEGTLFLDEIGDLGEPSQVKLLRLLQEQEYYPIGSDVPHISNARIIAATNKNLRKLVADKTFRNDLYYRLCSHQVQIPPLRDRKEDIALLLDAFLEEAAEIFHKKVPAYPHELNTMLTNYSFPGNIRELKALAFDAVARHRQGMLSLEFFKDVVGQLPSPLLQEAALTQRFSDWLRETGDRFPKVCEVEDLLIDEAMHLAKGNQRVAASLLGYSRQTLNKRLMSRKKNRKTEYGS
ncbi:sigma-54-dependent transcriptional regulator [Desulfogranum japonicum]|uniref:sigma-54-dependent transcriptional regulator n=1 Tax=Desulfogranum japonicum TaxID=231447 RepID=UPI0004194598|nr:sigma-54 dependent transcriptional regulator [Desulfogranum japonicum]